MLETEQTNKTVKRIILLLVFLSPICLYFWIFDPVPFWDTNNCNPPDRFNEDIVRNYPEVGIKFYKSFLEDFSWSPDSTRLAGHMFRHCSDDVAWAYTDYIAPTEIYIWDISGNNYSIASKGDWGHEKYNATWNPVYEKIMYYCSYCSRSGDFKGSNRGYVNLETMQYIGLDIESGLHWFPDGERMLTGDFDILDLDSNIIDEIQVTFDDAYRINLRSVSPNGETLLIYVAYKISDNEIFEELNLYSIETDEIVNIFDEDAYRTNWSSDNEWILIYDKLSSASEQYNLIGVNKISHCRTETFNIPSNDRFVASFKKYDFSFAWSPDGKTFAISGELEGVGRGIFLIDTDSDLILNWLSSGTCGEE